MTADGAGGGATRRRRDSTLLSDAEIDRRVSKEILRALGIANMLADALVSQVAERMAVEHFAPIPARRVREIVEGMIADGTVEEFDAARANASGVGCPCCTGGQDVSGAEAAAGAAGAARPVLRAAGGALVHPVAHAAYCLLSAWHEEYGVMDRPDRMRFQKDLCARGKYGWDVASESVRLLVGWHIFEISKGVIAIKPPGRRLPA